MEVRKTPNPQPQPRSPPVADHSKIEWTQATWNPITGCSKTSAGCEHCYALAMSHRLAAMGNPHYAGVAEKRNGSLVWTGIRCHDDVLDVPLHWRARRRIFVCSMSDLFHPDVSDGFQLQVWNRMLEAPQHIYQVLTKRPERMLAFLAGKPPLPNVWLGVTVENADNLWRIDKLLECPAAVRFVSAEPLLGPVVLPWSRIFLKARPTGKFRGQNGQRQIQLRVKRGTGLLHWVIIGGESGPRARPMHPDWPRSIRDACVIAKVPFFFKQWGEWAPAEKTDCLGIGTISIWQEQSAEDFIEGKPLPRIPRRPRCHEFADKQIMARVGKNAAGRTLDGRTWGQIPEMPAGKG